MSKEGGKSEAVRGTGIWGKGWTYVEEEIPEEVDEEDDSFRNGPRGVSSALTLANLVSGKRERRPPPPAPVPAPAAPGRKRAKKPAAGRAAAVEVAEAPDSPSGENMSFLALGTASRGPLGSRPKTLAELYPWRELSPEWMHRATHRLSTPPAPAWSAARSSVPDYSGPYSHLVQGLADEQLRLMWQVCQCVPGEGSAQEPLYGEINRTGVSHMFAIWKELCEFGPQSRFLDVGSGLAKMVFHAAIDPGVERAYGIELSEYRADAASRILKQLMPTVGLSHLAEKVSLVHQDVKTQESWEGITHIYMFDLGFPAEQRKGPYPHILKLWAESSTAKYLISYRKPSFLWQRGFNLKLVSRLRVKQQGAKAGSHLAYFYVKEEGEEQEGTQQ